jgi:hypothetical protein
MDKAPNKTDGSATDRNDLSDYLREVMNGEKSKLKWEGSNQQLESFFKTRLSLTGNWWSTHNLKTSDDITITFYNTKQTLLIQGKNGDKLKAVLQEIARQNGNTR